MKNSVLVERIEELACRYVDNAWGCSQERYLSIEYIMVSFMKYADPDFMTEEVFNKLSTTNKEEVLELRKLFESKRIHFSRDQRERLRSKLNKPNKNSEQRKMEVKLFAEKKAQQEGMGILTAKFYLNAIFSNPSEILIENIPELQDESKFGNLFELSREKKQLRSRLLNEIFGQDEAVDAFVEGYASSKFLKAGSNNARPKGIFIFAGPPGVGKTFLAETASQMLGLPAKRFDMSEYTDPQSACMTLIGLGKEWKGSQEGELTSFVDKCNAGGQDCFLIFDEIEKAHLNVIHLFLQILDAGHLRDQNNRKKVSFANTYIVFTTNAGCSLYDSGRRVSKGIEKANIIDALRNDVNPVTHKKYFPEAILSRFESGYPIMFRHLSAMDLVSIGKKEMNKCGKLFQNSYGPEVYIDDTVPFLLLLKKGGECDARVFRAECEKFVYNQLFSLVDSADEEMLASAIKKTNRIRFVVDRETYQSVIDNTCENDTNSIMLISEDLERLADMERAMTELEDMFDEKSALLPLNSYTEAKKGLQKGVVYPSIIVADLPKTESLSAKFNLNAPLKASSYSVFLDFLDYVSVEMPETIVYVLLDQNYYAYTNMISELLNNGVKDVVHCVEVDDVFLKNISKIMKRDLVTNQLQASAYRYAREKKALAFSVSPNEVRGEIVIRITNFKVTTVTSCSDKNSMVSEERMPTVTFEDYIGAETIKAEMREFIEFLKNPRKYKAAGGEQPKGILLYGPPGTGKTFFAKALAHEARVPFFAANGSSFITKYQGSGPQAIRDLFETARKYSPAIIFIDEIDGFAKRRTGSENLKAEEETLNMLLSEIDGFEEDFKRPVFLIAATNYSIDSHSSTSLDPALVRRFTRAIYVDLPNQSDRKKYFISRLQEYNCILSEEFLETIAKRSVGMNYGDIKNVVDKAVRDAKRTNTLITEEIFNEALETIKFGEKKNWGVENLERVAWHEAGHAYISWKCGQTPEYITITARGDFGGYVMPASTEDKPSWTKADILNRVKVCLAGRAAEIVRYGKEEGLSTGPSGDIQKAGQLLMQYVCAYGMDEKLGVIFVRDLDNPPIEIRNRVDELMMELLNSVLDELLQEKEKMMLFVDTLLMRNNLTGYEINEILKEVDK